MILIGNLSADDLNERTSELGKDESENIHSGYSTSIIQTCVTSNCHRYPHKPPTPASHNPQRPAIIWIISVNGRCLGGREPAGINARWMAGDIHSLENIFTRHRSPRVVANAV